MSKLILNDIIRERLLKYALDQIHQGHWGNAELTIPEYQNLYEKIRDSGRVLALSGIETGIIIQWISDSTRDGRMLIQEDITIIDSMIASIGEDQEGLEKLKKIRGTAK
jgi:hypothetical protein